MTAPTSPPLSSTRIAKLALLGAVYWFAAALFIRATSALWVGGGMATVVVFALVIPVTVPALLLGLRIAGLTRDRATVAATVMTGAAALLDGVALTWFPTLYGSDPAIVLGGAAAILWGAGIALVLGIVIERRG